MVSHSVVSANIYQTTIHTSPSSTLSVSQNIEKFLPHNELIHSSSIFVIQWIQMQVWTRDSPSGSDCHSAQMQCVCIMMGTWSLGWLLIQLRWYCFSSVFINRVQMKIHLSIFHPILPPFISLSDPRCKIIQTSFFY